MRQGMSWSPATVVGEGMSARSGPGVGELALFAEAWVALTLASLAVRSWPFRWIVGSAGFRGRGGGPRDPAAIAVAVRRASRRVPWRTVCFQEGLAAQWMLRRRGAPARLHYGIRSDADRLSAHVWVTLRGRPVIGEEREDPHRCVATFPAPVLDA